MLTDGAVSNTHLQSSLPSGPQREPCVIAVTVTYGEHEHLVRPVLLSLLQQPAIRKIILVSNAVPWNVNALVEELGPDRIDTITLDSNYGSAGGYAAGIRRACDLGAEYIWLLDHDNVPQDSALSQLLIAHAHFTQEFSPDKIGVVAYRPLHHTDLNSGVPVWRTQWRPSSFWGFHIVDIPYKIWRRTPWGHPKRRGPLPSAVNASVAMFGGLLFHRAVVDTHGLPREDFVVYADDSEFTQRIVRAGGVLRIIPSAQVDDIDASWYVQHGYGNTFARWLKGGSDIRIFYCARNHTYLDRHCLPNQPWMYWVNQQVYCAALWFLALIWSRRDRYHLIKRAVRDGLAGRLGIHPEYPITK